MRFKPTRLLVCAFLVLGSAFHLIEAQVAMKVNDKDYLDTQGFSVFLYDSTYHPVFVDQKNTAMEMILHDQRIATNGDVRLMPTPEQWDLVATLKGRTPITRTTGSPPISRSRPSISATPSKSQRNPAAYVSASISTSRCPGSWPGAPASTSNSCPPSTWARHTWSTEPRPASSRAPRRSHDQGAPPARRAEESLLPGGLGQGQGIHPATAFRSRARASRSVSTTRWPASTSRPIRPTSCSSMAAIARRTAGSSFVR